jgi:hypothetical protein
MTGDESAHAEADECERLLLRDLVFDFLTQAFGEWLDAMAGIARTEVWHDAAMAFALELALKGFENRAGVHESVHQHHMGSLGFLGERAHGNQNRGKQMRERPGHEISTGWPIEWTPTQEVDVQMRDGLAAVAAIVDNKAETAVGDTLLAGNGRGGDQETAEQVGVVLAGSGDARDRFFGDHQNVDGRLRRYVAKRKAVIVLMDDVGWDFAVADLFEECFFLHLRVLGCQSS